MNKRVLEFIRKLGPYIFLGLGLFLISATGHMSLQDVFRVFMLLLGSIAISWIIFFTLDIGVLRQYHNRVSDHINRLQDVVGAFLPTTPVLGPDQRGIVPEFNESILPQIRTTSSSFGITTDRLAEVLQVRQLIDQCVLFQGTQDYRKALLDAASHPPVHEIRFLGTLLGARQLLLDPLLDHINANCALREVKLVASRKQTSSGDLRIYAISFIATLASKIYSDCRCQALRQGLANNSLHFSIVAKFLPTDMAASTLIIGDKLFILAPTHGIEDHEQVVNFNIGLIVPRQTLRGTTPIYGNDIIARQRAIFDDIFGATPDEKWSFSGDRVRIERATWSVKGNTFDLETASQSTMDLQVTQLNDLATFVETHGQLASPYL